MDTFWTISCSLVYGSQISLARRFTQEEKKNYVEWFREIGMVGIGDNIELNHLTVEDMPNRQPDGEFLGCSNSAWIITEDEKEKFILINSVKEKEKRKKEIEEEKAEMQRIIDLAAKQPKLYTKAEAEQKTMAWINVYDEGGFGYVPHYYTIDEVENAKKWLEEHKD